MGNALSGSRVSQACCARATVGAHHQSQQPEAEPSGPFEMPTLCLCLNWGTGETGPNLLLCSLAASRSARCSKDAAALLNGAKPGELPIVQSTKVGLVLNAQIARMLGLTIPASLLAVADEVIE